MLERAESFNCRPAEGYGHTKLNKTSELLIEHQFIKLKRHHAKASTKTEISDLDSACYYCRKRLNVSTRKCARTDL